WPDIYGLGLDAAFGTFATTWYHKLDLTGVTEFVARYQKRWPRVAIDVPGNVSYNGYVATRELIRAIERAGTTNNIAVIKALEGHRMPAVDRMQHYDPSTDASSQPVQQSVYLVEASNQPVVNTDECHY